MSNAEKTLITVATYNEMENLPRLVGDVFRFAPDVDILVIDDGSPDGTGQWCDEKSRRGPPIAVLPPPGKLGLGGAIVAGMKYAIDHGYRYMLNMDADFSHQPEYLPNLIGGMDPPGGRPVDVMIGSRYIPGGGIEGWPWKRHLMSRGVNFYARWLLGLSPEGLQRRVSLLSGVAVGAVGLRRRPQPRVFVPRRNLWRLARLGGRFGETPIVFVDRTRGQSKIDSGEAFAAMRIILALGVENLCRRPRAQL